jgi:hypothetical protein
LDTIKPLDFREICADSKRLCCDIVVESSDGHRYPWLQLGAMNLGPLGSGSWVLKAHMARGATDFEHSAALVMRLQLNGLIFSHVAHGYIQFRAWVYPDPRYFQVPDASYNPLAHPDTKPCEICKGDEAHPIVPEGFFLPDPNPSLWRTIMPYALLINMGPV